MSEKNKRKEIGVTISSLGGLATIFSMTTLDGSDWQLLAAVGGVVLALIGLFIIGKESKGQNKASE